MNLINSLDSAFDTIENGEKHLHELKRKIAKAVIENGLPVTMRINYSVIKKEAQISINAAASEKNSFVLAAKSELQSGLDGKAGKAAIRKCESLSHGNFTQGADSI
ncbi:hypothetical protein [Fructilactobacillus carniphilus]|uniref:Phage protein n=1 Tax=Fructilactobacillus carniphilus TaxID=2940297 RepID=A0ABY5BWV3_9LACO|nr:hypothetical protein [Fructilactobacillus carniphilus]USS90284.1 hypothetical protein M3M37_05425 [Fructilactobacillus carniphilus]